MKTVIVTFIRAYNHGAILQAYALHKKIEDLGIENEMLDYCPDYFSIPYGFRSPKKLKRVPFKRLVRWIRCFTPYRPIKQYVANLSMLRVLNKRMKGFERFIERNICLSKKQYFTTEEINQAQLEYDFYICGSDQVWHSSCAQFDPVYFLDFPSANKAKKISYAASFGFTSIPDNLKEEYRRRLTGWDKYSVREESGIDILRDLNISDAVVCCDPTLLLKKAEWEEVCSKKKEKKPYILVYYLNPKTLRIAKQLADKKQMRVISITSSIDRRENLGENSASYGIKHHGACAPDEFLSLFANASYVITDSFHGTIFSLINHKQFLSTANVRVDALLKVVGIENRLLSNDLANIDNEIDWEKVDKNLDAYRQGSIDYLKSLKDCLKS